MHVYLALVTKCVTLTASYSKLPNLQPYYRLITSCSLLLSWTSSYSPNINATPLILNPFNSFKGAVNRLSVDA